MPMSHTRIVSIFGLLLAFTLIAGAASAQVSDQPRPTAPGAQAPDQPRPTPGAPGQPSPGDSAACAGDLGVVVVLELLFRAVGRLDRQHLRRGVDARELAAGRLRLRLGLG